MTNLNDFALPDRQQFLKSYGPTLLQKRNNAVAWLGKRYVFHKSNRVTKLDEPLPEVFTWQPKVLKRGRK